MDFPPPANYKQFHHDVYPAIDPTLPQLSAKGKFVVITGGGSGIGLHIAEAFAKAQASKIALLGRTKKTLLSTKQSLESRYPTEVSVQVADVSQETALNKAFQELEKLGPVNILVSNAGYMPDNSSVKDADLTDWWNAYEVNVKAALFLTRALLKSMAKNAVLINVSAGLAHTPSAPQLSAYASSKLAAAKVYEHVQVENPDLQVINLHPGILPTDMAAKASSGSGIDSSWTQDTFQLPAHVAVWLASPEAAFLKGKFIWANWDIEELKADAKEIESTNKFTSGVYGTF